MKFYYEGKLVRTSKTHHYTHALIDVETGKVVTCSTSAVRCESEKKRYIRVAADLVENCHRAIKALYDGKKGFHGKDGKHEFYHAFTDEPFDTIEGRTALLEEDRKYRDSIIDNWKVVPLTEVE